MRELLRKSRTLAGLLGTGAVMLTVTLGAPLAVDLSMLFNLTLFAAMSVLALSLAFVWGFGGILSFGQAAFFGIGGYAYTMSVINLGESTAPFFISIGLPMAFAALLGYFMFFGRLNDVYLAVVTLGVTLILFSFISSTAGEAYRIGTARFNGFNGIPSIPPLNVPGRPDLVLFPEHIFYLAMAMLMATYFGLRALLASYFGRVIVAIRENELRAELLGYNVRVYKLVTFVIGAGIAGLAGCLFANWGAFITPNVFNLATTAQIIMWVIIGGIGTLIGPILGCVALQYLATILGTQQTANTSLIFGAILLVFVLLVPRGILPTLRLLANRSWRKANASRSRREQP